MKKFKLNFKSIVRNKARWLLTLFAILTLGVGQMWGGDGNLYIIGDEGLTGHDWSNDSWDDRKMNVTFKAVAAGDYYYKVRCDGYDNCWSGGDCCSSATGTVSKGTSSDDGAMQIKVSEISDISFTLTGSGWSFNAVGTASGYYLKYPWGDNHAWTWSAALTDCGGGIYACTGPYNGTTYDYGRRNSDGGAGGAAAVTGATPVNSPSTDDKCVFELNYSTGALTITRCNKVTATNHVYFDNSTSNFSGNLYFVIGHDKPTAYSCVYTMTRVTGTNYYHAAVDATWDDATYYAVIASSSDKSTVEGNHNWGSSSLSSKGTSGYTAAYTGKYDLEGSNKVYTITTASSGNGQAMTITYQSAGIGFFNKAQTLHVMFSNNGGSTYSDVTTTAAAWHGTITAERKYLNSDFGTVVDHTGASKETLSSSAYVKDAIIGSNYVLAETSTATGYTFAGWGNSSSATPDGNASKTLSSISGTNNIYAFFKAVQSTITLAKNDGGGTSVTQTATYGESAASRAGSLPTRSGYGFDGYWTTADNSGVKVIKEDGTWKSNITGYTDSNGKWICTSGSTLYAHWLATGYYLVGPFTNWEATISKFSGSPLKSSVELDKSDYSGASYKTSLKIRQVKANTTSACNDVWFGKNDTEIGKGSPTASGLSSSGANIGLQVYYDGEYTFTLTESAGAAYSITVAVPVVDQLQIYSSSPSGGAGIANHNWGPAAANKVSTTVALSASTTYQFKAVYDSEYWSKSSGSITRVSNSLSGITHTGSEGNMSITTDVAGDYTFELDMTSSKEKVTVTYPTKYLVTYGTSPAAAADAPTLDKTLVDGYIADGTTITFTKGATTNTGYTWKGWYDNSAGTGVALGTGNTYTTTISAATTVYAVYTEDMHTVTVAKDATGGSINTTSVSAGIATASTTITATPTNNAWRFWYWEVPGDGSITIVGGDNTASSITIKATADSKTITAHFEPAYALEGSRKADGNPTEGMPGWGSGNAASFNVVSYTTPGGGDADITVDLQCVRTLLPNRQYKFQVWDRTHSKRRGCTSEGILPAEGENNWKLDGTQDVLINTVGYGTYTFKITKLSNDDNMYPSVEVTRQASHQLTMGKKVIYNEDNSTLTNASSEGTITAQTNEGGGDGFAITNSQFFADGSDIVFTAIPADGYEVEGWYYDADCASNHKYADGTDVDVDGNTLTLSSLTAATTVYVKFAEKMTTVTLNTTGSGQIKISDEPVTSVKVGVHTTYTITAVPATGYYVSGWTVSDGADCAVGSTDGRNDNESQSTTLRGLGTGTTGTVTANFVECDKIYFRNENETTGEKLWDKTKIYVYFNVGWAADGVDYGGVNNLGTNAEMNPISADSHIFWAYVPRSFTYTVGEGTGAVAFSDKWMGGSAYPDGVWTKFHEGNGVYRTDYSIYLNMYVPACTKKYTSNSTNYFDNGFWMKYNNRAEQDAGYYLKEGNKDNQVDIFKTVADNATKLVAKYRFENTSDHTFFIANAAGKFYKASATITNAACTNVNVIDDAATPVGFTITPTSEGYYTFYIEQAGDTMKLSINYPISPGDYRLDYTHDTDKHLYSDVIKPDNASSTNVKKSVYIDPGTTGGSLKLQKCSGLDGSANPMWTSGVSVGTLSDIFKTGSPATATKGVYEFEMVITDGTAVSADVTSVELKNVKLYTGNYYIKTDYAPGHWVNYKENVLNLNTINFDKDDDKTFDYYHCAWVGDGDKNVKCIIANDYNEQITDTLIGDDILGLDGGKPRQYLAEAANVRFSYNSYTNELKRAYINGATSWQKSYLRISAGDDGIIKGKAGNTWATNDTTFVDNNNWTYMLDLQAKEGARIKLTANYNFNSADHEQYLIGKSGDYVAANTEELIGGTGSAWLTVRVIYDFKTNNLLAAWLATDLATDKTLNADIMVLRDNQGDARTITLTNSAKITEIDTAYSVVHLNKWYLTNKKKDYSADSTLTDSERRYYWLSFPYQVRVSDIFGSVGTFGVDWILQRYNGKKRAANGFWLESPSNWEYITDPSTVLNAFEGYVLTLDLSEFTADKKGKWGNNVEELFLYFPSTASIENIETQTDYDVLFLDQSDYYCDKDRSAEIGGNGEPLGPEYDRTKRDSYWHLIGIPSFAAYNGAKDAEGNTISWTGASAGEIDWRTDNLPFLYEWSKTSNTLSPTSTSAFTFKPMQAYLVQYGGEKMTWSTVVAPKASIVARRKARLVDDYFAEFNLHLTNNEKSVDHTYVRMTDNEDVTAGFEFGQDLCKEYQNGANIYTLIDQLEVAGNSMPLSNQTTIVPVGVKIAINGEYTFSMPEGTDGIGVVLVDNIANTRTNLGLMDYTVTLSQGKIDNRFWLEISPIKNAPTGIELLNGENGENGVRKVMIDGVLYIVRDGKVFDATGALVK